MREIRWKVYAAVAAMAIGAFLVVPNSGWTRVAVLVAIGYAAVAAVLVGLRRNDPTGRAGGLAVLRGRRLQQRLRHPGRAGRHRTAGRRRLARADRALYEAKHAGRNCVRVAGSADRSAILTG